jgi:hypothetical protein
MNSAIHMTRSTVLADVHARRRDRAHPSARSSDRSIVRVGRFHVGVGARTLVGNAAAFVGADPHDPAAPAKPGTAIAPTEPKTTTQKVVGAVSSVASYGIAASMIAGPPMAGYLLFGTFGLVVGSIVAAPLAIYFTLSVAQDLGLVEKAKATAGT